MPSNHHVERILKTVFGYQQFKPLQSEIIHNILNHNDTLAIMPTGGGKSLCYQIPALIFPGLTVVVSPLIALMKDQVEQLTALGVAALFLNSSLSIEEYQANLARVRKGEIKLLYVAPETLLTPRLFGLLAEAPLNCITIDEAHCISEWGHDFRPEYRQLAVVRERFPQAVCLALTATATARVRSDIKATLKFKDADEFIASFDRPNLFIEVLEKSEPSTQLLEFLRARADQSGIIYCFSRRTVDELSAYLNAQGHATRPYHAGLDDGVRNQNQELFIHDDIQIIVATIAFGMGINKPNVRFVVHHDLPRSIEGYYQEIGRAGRDGLPAHCLLLYGTGDVGKLSYFIDQKDEPHRSTAYQHLAAMTRFAESQGCRRAPLLGYFGEQIEPHNCAMCDNCQSTQGAEGDITIPTQKFLSCVLRTGERFGVTYITHVLVGAEDQKIKGNDHHRLSTFGIGKDLTRRQWLLIAQQLVEKGYLQQSIDMYRTLRVTAKGHEMIKKRTPVIGLIDQKRPPKARIDLQLALHHDKELFALLRQKRKILADQERVPPYVVFSDKTLVEMATYFPMTPASLKTINGVGSVKLELYGSIFIEVIQNYCQAHQIPERSKAGKRNSTPPRSDRILRYIQVGEAYNQGQTIQALMAFYHVTSGTIMSHLVRYALEGHPIRSGEDIAPPESITSDTRQAVMQAFDELGTQALGPIYNRLYPQISYDDLRLLLLESINNPSAGENLPFE